MEPAYLPSSALRGRVGLVVPTWYGPQTPAEVAERLLLTTLNGCEACLHSSEIVVVCDGSPVAAQAARKVRELLGEERSFRLLELPENQGKGGALLAGFRELLDNPTETRPVEWVMVRDADGDHLIDDAPHLFRVGEQVAADHPDRPVCVIGSRASLHAPLGWVRAEFELLLNEVLVDAVSFALAHRDDAWDSRFLVSRAPDLQSGYKLYSRAAVRLAIQALENESTRYPDLGLMRTGMEVVPFVALALAGAIFAEVGRKTYFDQPITSYGNADFARFYGSKLAWALCRCDVPPRVATLLIDSALARSALYHDPEGREKLLRMRTQVLEWLNATGADQAMPEPLARTFL